MDDLILELMERHFHGPSFVLVLPIFYLCLKLKPLALLFHMSILEDDNLVMIMDMVETMMAQSVS